MRGPILLLCAPLLAAAGAQQPVVRTVLGNGSTTSRYDLVILADGYQAAEEPRFDQDVATFLTALFQKEPYATFGSYVNVHTVFRASQDSGASQPDAVPPIVRNTAYGASYDTGGVGRCLYIQDTSLALADAALAPANEGRALVLVNDSRYGGCAATFAVSYNGASMTEVQIHEMGHSLASLADEYDYPYQTYSGPEPAAVNITTDATGQKWSHWWGFDSISSWQGAGYHLAGLYRPKNDCLMRDLGIPLCAVCREQISRALNAVVDTIESPQPAGTTVGLANSARQTFAFTTFVPPANNPLITWTLDGCTVPGQNGTAFLFDAGAVPLGAHTLQAVVQDRTPLVRVDPAGTMRDTCTWNVTVTDPAAAELRLTAMAPGSFWVQPGGDLDLATTVRNDGPNAAAGVTVEHFLSPDAVLDTGDLYLGGQTLATLAAGQELALVRRARLPALLEARAYYLLGVVDRRNSVYESNETDNQRLAAVFGQPGGCAPALEFRDDLLYPRDHASIALAVGGSVLPTVVARCAAPGTQYLVVFGCSGTSPGTPLGAGLTVPLNADAFTLLGLQQLDGPVFQQFWGQLDAQGIGRATFALPAGLSLLPCAGHFAAILIDGTPAFTGVTNAVAIDLLP